MKKLMACFSLFIQSIGCFVYLPRHLDETKVPESFFSVPNDGRWRMMLLENKGSCFYICCLKVCALKFVEGKEDKQIKLILDL